MHNYDKLMLSIDTWGLYQKILSLIVILSTFPVPALVVILPAMQQIPGFSVEQDGKMVKITDEEQYCSLESNWTRRVHFEAAFTNWSTELNIVCNRKIIMAFTSTAYFLGCIIASTSFSKFADRFGRKPIFMLMNMISFITLIQLYFLNDINQIILATFSQGLANLNMVQGNILLKEVVDKKYYGLMFGIANAAFPITGLVNLFFVYYFGNWHYYQITLIVVISIGNVLSFLYLEESPPWLFANGHIAEFKQTIKRIAALNGRSEGVDDSLGEVVRSIKKHSGESLSQQVAANKHKYSYGDMFKFGSLRVTSLALTYLYIISGFSFYGILLNLSGFTGSIVLDALITYSGETLAEIVSGDFSFKFGRKKTILISYVLAFLGSVLFYFTSDSFKTFSIVMLFLSSIGIASGFNVLYIYAAEVYPTNIRSLSITFLSMINRITSGVIPTFLTMFADATVPVIAIMSIGAVFVGMLLPSTEHQEPTADVLEIEENTTLKKMYSSDSSFHSIYLNQYYESN